jgi:hypothetical protein
VDAGAAPGQAGLRVRVAVDVKGELFSPAGPDAAPVREPVNMEARFDFEERSGAGGGSARLYHEAAATMQRDGHASRCVLAADARRVVVARQGTTPVPHLADAVLSNAESALLETPFDSLLLDDLLPDAAVAVGDGWAVPADLAAGLLAIDTVEAGGINARLEQVADGRARIVLSGIVDGAADGVPTHVTVEGSFAAAAIAAGTAPAAEAAAAPDAEPDADTDAVSAAASGSQPPDRHRLQGPVGDVTVVLLERRQASHVAPGFEVEARISVARTAVDAGDAGEAAEIGGEDTAPVAGRPRGAGGPGRVWHRDAAGRFDLVHDGRWRIVEDGASGLVMRLVDRGALVGQCSITVLQGTAGVRPTAAEVRADIERALAGQISRVEGIEETAREDGLGIVRLTAAGHAGKLPFRWSHYVVSAPDGSLAHVTFMCEEPMRQRFGDADRDLVAGLRLPGPGRGPGEASPTTASDPARRTTR